MWERDCINFCTCLCVRWWRYTWVADAVWFDDETCEWVEVRFILFVRSEHTNVCDCFVYAGLALRRCAVAEPDALGFVLNGLGLCLVSEKIVEPSRSDPRNFV